MDDEQEAAQNYQVTAMPTIIFLKDGVELNDKRVVGANMAEIESRIRELAELEAASKKPTSQIAIPITSDASIKCQRPTASGAK